MFADIIVDISVEALNRTYQYIVPEELEEKLQIGSCVFIPFGNGNRKIRGFILGFSEKPEIEVERMKAIDSIDEKAITMESQLIQLAAYIQKMYGSTMNEACKTVLPVRRQIKSVNNHWLSFATTETEIKSLVEECERKHYVAKVRLLSAMLKQGGKIKEQVVMSQEKISKPVVDGLIKQGYISRVSERIYRIPDLGEPVQEGKTFELNEEQRHCVNVFENNLKQNIQKTYLLHGITGSGKTEVYIEMMRQVIQAGKQGIILIPEIALTKQTVDRFVRYFGNQVCVLHSRMSEGERFDQYERAKAGEVQLVIGPRSALFMPFEHLGLIIVDEEHEGSYKSDSTPRYHAREVAEYRAKIAGASVILGSATPSVESYSKALTGEYELLEMKHRAGNGKLPKIYVEDLREEMKAKNHSIFSRRLQHKIRECLERKEQVMLFLNRRGFAGFVSCRSCGNVLKCPHCDVSYKAHKTMTGKVDQLTCHYCGHTIKMPERCPKCGSPYIAGFGLGTQKVEDITKKMFPQARVLRMDADTTTGKNGHERILGAFRRGEADILIGTQMIVKGHDFPKVTLVGILAAELSMHDGDYRSSERTFQLLMQASGRAGRAELPGDVVIQSYDPEHYAIQAVLHQNYMEFYENEMAYRRMMHYPPVWNILAVMIASKDEALSKEWITQLAAVAREQKMDEVTLIGPTPMGIHKKSDWYRNVFYLKAASLDELFSMRKILEYENENCEKRNKISTGFDLNPMTGY